MLALAAWHARRRSSSGALARRQHRPSRDTTLSYALDRLILSARVASAAGDAGLRARVLQATEMLERERPAVPLLAGSPAMPAEYLSVTPQHWLLPPTRFVRRRDRFFMPALPRTPAASWLAHERDAEALDQLNAAFDTFMECEALADARRSAAHCADWAWNGASSPTRGQKRAGTASPTPSSRSSTSSLKVRPTAPSHSNCSFPLTQ